MTPDCGSTGLLGLTAIVLASLAAFAAQPGGQGPPGARNPARCRRQGVAAGLDVCAGNHRLMREESQLDEMRAAIRGDFERLAERRGEQELMRISDDEPELHSDDDAAEPEEELHLSWTARLGRWLTQSEDPSGGSGAL